MLPYIITYICLTTNPLYNQACNQALNATAIELHVKQDLDLYQDNFQKIIETEIDRNFDKRIVGVGIMGYQMYSKQALIFSAPIRPVADTLSTNISGQSQNLSLTWTF